MSRLRAKRQGYNRVPLLSSGMLLPVALEAELTN
jgi:hypothetical protein